MSATAFQRRRRELAALKAAEEKKYDDPVAKTENTKIENLTSLKVAELRELAKEKGVTGTSKMNQEDLIQAILEAEET
ncbi:Rho termination factor N-terminal domain-containing protein [Risungbinella massiliensis]|uniref:Rho termination factor N-terminal domain-containing protein n=1 Tax=Risungbinella massiliensis TaxID=1329796 RepID=UPI00069A3731|nr:Rho termination factor N-terminal domain-containing protein [Risungbinella massiliensis]